MLCSVEAEMMQTTYNGHRIGAEGAMQIVLANSQQPMTEAEATSVAYTRDRAQWQAHKKEVQDRTVRLLQSKTRRLQQSRGLPTHVKESKLK